MAMMALASPGVSADPAIGSSYPKLMVAVAVAAKPYIIVSRPLHELWAHISSCELPSWDLVARAISTLFLAIFRWHLCDHALLPTQNGVYHSMEGRGVICESFNVIDEHYPHLREQALRLETIDQAPHLDVNVNVDVTTRALEQLPEMTPQAVCAYFQVVHNKQIANRAEGTTLYDIVYSPYLREIERE